MKRFGRIGVVVILVVFVLSLVLVFLLFEKVFSLVGSIKKIVFWYIIIDVVGK